MAEYIEREAFIESQQHLYCENCARRKDGKGKFVYDIGDAPCRACDIMDVLDAVEDFPAADAPPLPLWTDEPISGSEFMTHNQGQSGFEIHFRTDDKAKYEAVQDECRRQIGHAKPAADVRPVVTCAECKHNNACLTQAFVEEASRVPFDRTTFFCADGKRADDA